MKVILVNGSPHEKGCTYTALTEVQKQMDLYLELQCILRQEVE